MAAPQATSQQASYLQDFIVRYNQRTQKSKQQDIAYRPIFADFRTIDAFRFETKEMVYPITAQASQGSRIWDLDGNEYIDLTMGFGVNLFGHQPDFVMKALREQLDNGLHVGPQSNYAGEVAQLICEVTGMDRITYCNSGTEAVFTAIRIARACTKREKIVMFDSSYHGHSDAVLAIRNKHGTTKPNCIGVDAKSVENTIILDYCSAEALEYIRAHGHELAAVLVEPVQTRKPSLQPREFLKELREITAASGTVLFFDEMVTGFRLKPGGAQEDFGIRADIVTYGKALGGGMPIGVVAGCTKCMNHIDGGWWQYGDKSFPSVEHTFYGGTFCKHPLAMVAARAVLQHLKQQGRVEIDELNARTDRFIRKINTYFEQNNIALALAGYSSLFRFETKRSQSKIEMLIERQPLELELFYANIIYRGLYLWEARRSFLSTAHTDAECDYIVSVVKDSIEELQANGYSFTL